MTSDRTQISGHTRGTTVVLCATHRLAWKSWLSPCARNLVDCAKLSARIGESRAAFEKIEVWWDNDEKTLPRAHLEKDSGMGREKLRAKKLVRVCHALFERARRDVCYS